MADVVEMTVADVIKDLKTVLRKQRKNGARYQGHQVYRRTMEAAVHHLEVQRAAFEKLARDAREAASR